MRPPARPLAILLLSLAAALAARAEEATTPGALSVTGKDGKTIDMPLRHTKVSIDVTAFVARATVEQVFANPFEGPVEAVYTFPLGDRAAVDDFELTVGDRTIRGEIKRRDEARRTYETARAAGYQAALLEQQRPNIFTQRVGNLEPGKSITVRLRTVETLRYERGTYRLSFPLVVGPRYIPGGAARVPDAASIVPPRLAPGERSGHDVDIEVAIDAGVPLRGLQCVSHRVVTERSGATSARVRLAGDDRIPNKDFQLSWGVSSERPAVALLAHRDGLDGFFTLLVQPKGEIDATEAMPKEITLVVDTSGSMAGIPLQASQRFIAKALHELGPRDTFNVIRFAGDNEIFSKDPLPNTPSEIERAIAWVNAQSGGGGTEMLSAMRAAFARPADPNRLRMVIFFTDGEVGNDEEILRDIGAVLGDARIYTVGIGWSVNRYLLDRMADLGRGVFMTITPDEAADQALEAFRSWVTRPYLTGLTVDWGALPIADVSPDPIRDLGSGQTLKVVGRYLNGAEGDVVVRGKLGGRYWEQTLHVALPDREAKHAPLAALWARGRIEDLLLLSPGAPTDAVRAEVTELALEYRLMSPFTSFVAVDDAAVVNPSGTAPTVHQAVPLPEGVSFAGVYGLPDGEGNPNANGARERDFRTTVSGISNVALNEAAVAPPTAGRFYQNKLKLAPPLPAPAPAGALPSDTAWRVLADLADDGKLSPAEGKPAIAALLAAQKADGAIDDDPGADAIATWALAEAAKAMPTDARIKAASTKALDHLAGVKTTDAQDLYWVRLVLAALRPAALSGLSAPKGEGSPEYLRLRAAMAGARSGAQAPRPSGHGAFERLLATIGRGHLMIERLMSSAPAACGSSRGAARA